MSQRQPSRPCWHRFSLGLCLSLVGFGYLANGSAQNLPPAAEPRPRQLDSAPVQRAAEPLPDIQIIPQPYGAPPNAERIKFILQDLQVEGATAYSQAQLRQLYEAEIGKEISLLQLFQIAERIQERYREDGYILTRVLVPPQTVKDGKFRLQVVEGFIDSLKLDGDVGPVEARLRNYLDKITGRQPVNIREIERYLLLATDVPGITARGVLRAKQDGPLGASELVVKVARKPYQGYAVANNRGSRYTGPARATVHVQENAGTAFGESLGVTLLGTLVDDEQEYAQLSYTQPIGSEGLSLRLSGSYGETEPGLELERQDVETESVRALVTLSYPAIRSRRQNLYVRGGFDYVNSEADLDLLDEELYEDRTRVVFAGLGYDFFDNMGARTYLSAGLRQGLDMFDASDEGDDLSRAEADPQATVIVVDANRQQPLDGLHSLDLSLAGQYAFDPLVSDEEFTVGGERFGRGYDPAELAGDHGLGLGLELRRSLAAFTGDTVTALQAYGFYDLGVVWNKDEDADSRDSLASAGVGVRAQFTGNLFADLEVAKPLNRTPGTESDKDPRLYVQVFATF